MSALNPVPMSPALGAEVANLPLDALDDSLAPALRDALDEHLVLVFRDQDLSPSAQIRFTEYFGSVREHPLSTRRHVEGYPSVLVLENRPGRRGAPNDYWHSDISHMASPPWVTVLHARTIPAGRGDTMFCNMYRALSNLSSGMREALTDRAALHSAEATMRRSRAESTDARPISDDELPTPNAHPIIRVHPGTGKPLLFVNPHFTTQIVGMTPAESAPWLETVYRAATTPENVLRHRWREGDVVIWDNRAVMHYAVRDYDESMPRLMHRTTGYGP
ncbi:MAG: TauD/TfdA family dioxygenase [Pseudomonadota bacterium]